MGKWLVIFVMLLSTILVGNVPQAEANANKITIGPGITYQNQTIVKQDKKQSINVVEVDLANQFTELELSVPEKLGERDTTTVQANKNSYEGHRVVGAINGSFFDMSSGLPMYLIAQDNKIINSGFIASGKSNYVSEPIAFGIDANGKAKIDLFNMNLRIAWDGDNKPATGVNKVRNENELVIYTPDHEGGYTNTNPYGMEFVVETNQDLRDGVHFGDIFTGTIQKIRRYGDTTNTAIPSNSFVVSFHGEMWMNRLSHLQIGDRIQFTADIDTAWKDASYIMASGPQLVKNGQVYITMDENSTKAKAIEPRSALAVDSTGQKVYLVTVDGRQPGFSEGMSMRQFAEYLVSIGVDRAINLDGGGSTTLGVRKLGDTWVTLANSPSGGRERAVSTALNVVSTAPIGQPTIIKSVKKQEGKLLVGSSVGTVTQYVLDKYYNPLNIDSTNLKYSVSGGIASADENGVITGLKAGTGSITVQYENATTQIPLEVIEKISKLTPVKSELNLGVGVTKKMTVKALDANGSEVIFDPKLVKWTATEGIGTITPAGEFKANSTEAKGSITATLANLSVTIPVTVSKIVKMDAMENLNNWKVAYVRGEASIGMSTDKDFPYEGKGAVKLNYNFVGQTGTSAAYVEAKTPYVIDGVPQAIGMRVFGDSSQSWLRGRIIDGNGTAHNINFTADKGLKWAGWNFVKADIPQNIPGPIKLEHVYIAQTDGSVKTKGTLMFDDIKAIFVTDYAEATFKDTGIGWRAEKEISSLVNRGIISGFETGFFGPHQEMTRVQAAILIARAMNLPTNNVQDPGFEDVPVDHRSYKEIAAVANAGIIFGKEDGRIFDPYGKLTRAEMAAVLYRAFKLPPATEDQFTDIGGTFAREAINSLGVNGITVGVGDGKFAPGLNITRADFSVFLYKTIAFIEQPVEAKEHTTVEGEDSTAESDNPDEL
ncbi:phosphodiester glycosidase family protein [Bacillus carboniphilus]